jgi:tRNA(fMet)-specific endonuclease VapC
MTYYLDTNICIYFLNGSLSKVRDRLLSKSPRDIAIPSIVKAELLFGAEKSKKRDENLEKINRFLLPLLTAGFDDEEASAYARIRAHLETAGLLIGPNDLLIAATVSAQGGILVTNNTREFSRVPGLPLEDWTE